MTISRRTAAVVIGVFSLGLTAAAAGPSQSAPSEPRADMARRLSGVWVAPIYKVAAGSDLDVQVWGKNASKVRKVNLTLEPSGQGIVTIYTSVEGPNGRTKPYSASVIEAHIVVEASPTSAPIPDVPMVTVANAEERYLDNTGERHTLEGIRIILSPVKTDPNMLNFRYDTPQGFGSFGETLHRTIPARTNRAAD